ncbi:MAG TPA: ABC transporter ATP-binding protein [Telluria sp.]|nr:ABC transporter ATP-binding protein [Telluria sp.]
MTGPRPPLFHLAGVGKTYGAGEVQVNALSGVDLDLYPGEFVVLLGPSGGGKSTLLNLLGALDLPTSGTLEWQGRDLGRLDEAGRNAFRRASIGFVFQFYNLVPSLTAFENVQLVTEISADPMPPAEALTLVGLGDRQHHFPAQLSGGEQQRVAIARAIAKRPAVLLCDEPTGALDCATGRVVLRVIEKIHRELGTTVVVITHNAAIAEMAERVIHLSNGRIQSIETNAVRRSPEEIQW